MGVAQTAWFPPITLTGNAGHASPELGDLFKWSARAWGVSALLSLPLWDGGQRDAQVQGANARLEQALASHREQVLTAFREVEDQLASLRWLARPRRKAVPSRPPAAPRSCQTPATATAWSASWNCATPAAANCATAARRYRCAPRSTRPRWGSSAPWVATGAMRLRVWPLHPDQRVKVQALQGASR